MTSTLTRTLNLSAAIVFVLAATFVLTEAQSVNVQIIPAPRQLNKSEGRFDFGADARIAYNVDSFGHSGGLPQLLTRAGYSHYVMMRPQAQELELPPLF